jgi:hypothetical protein
VISASKTPAKYSTYREAPSQAEEKSMGNRILLINGMNFLLQRAPAADACYWDFGG